MAEKAEILHLFVIGFHHKKGCQIEFSYPEVKTLPEQWKGLPSLAMPDGAHNYDSDAVYFHLPSLDNPSKTVFGISCFKQIPLEKVKIKTSDMTRGAVQKAVCVLSSAPLYGYIQIKMELVTAAFFEGDFSEVSLLKDAFHHLNDCLPDSYSHHLKDGLCVRDLVQRFRHRTLLLFKLLLLEKRVIFFHSPVKPLCCCLLSLISLHPGVVQHGLFESCCPGFSKLENTANSEIENCVERIERDEKLNLKEVAPIEQNGGNGGKDVPAEIRNKPNKMGDRGDSKDEEILDYTGQMQCQKETKNNDCDVRLDERQENERGEREEGEGERENYQDKRTGGREEEEEEEEKDEEQLEETIEEGVDLYFMDEYFSNLKSLENSQLGLSNLPKKSESVPGESSNSLNSEVAFISNLNLENYGLPLSLYSGGNLCLPYLSISYLDFLCRDDVRGFVGGAANVLFKQKRQLVDVLVELDGSKIETHCPELRRQLLLTTEDLRFGEQLIKELEMETVEDADEWIRAQFTLYLLSLLRTSLLQEGSKEIDHFNSHFVAAWKNTENYKIWSRGEHREIWDINPGHPFARNLSVTDMRLRLSQVMSSSESGRRINQAVTTTGKAVGGAINQAKGAFSQWWSSLTTSETKTGKPVENI